ncbi:MAG: FkbM family methyltransferase [Isosphaeraceae bacterium]
MRVRLENGMKIHGHSRAEIRLLFDEIFNKKVYLKNGIELRESDVVFDIGANVGLFSLFVSESLDDFKLFAFEPVQEICECLRRNTRHLGERAVILNAGVSDHLGQAVFTYYPRLPSLTTRFPDRLEGRWSDLKDVFVRPDAPGAHVAGVLRGPRKRLLSWCVDGLLYYASRSQEKICRLTSISSVIAEHGVERIDLLKIDVEGSEGDVLRGIEESDWEKIRQLVIEVHDIEGGVDSLVGWLERRGLEVTIDSEHEGRKSPLHMLYARRAPEEAHATHAGGQRNGEGDHP